MMTVDLGAREGTRSVCCQLRPERDDDAFGVVADERLRRGKGTGQHARHEGTHRRKVWRYWVGSLFSISGRTLCRWLSAVDHDSVNPAAEIVVDLTDKVAGRETIGFPMLGHHITYVDDLAFTRLDCLGDPINEETGHETRVQISRT